MKTKRRRSRILEKQNRLQMSQVFPYPRTSHQVVLLFKDSRGGTAEPKVTGFSHQLQMYARMKVQTQLAHRVRRDFPIPLTKFRSRNSEAASPKRRCSQRDLNTLYLAGLRRGLARKTVFRR
jgi:hypothetical protein